MAEKSRDAKPTPLGTLPIVTLAERFAQADAGMWAAANAVARGVEFGPVAAEPETGPVRPKVYEPDPAPEKPDVLTEVEHVCDRVAILQQGRLVHFQNMSELRKIRHIKVRLQKPMDSFMAPEHVKGMKVRDNELDFEYTGTLPDLLRRLADLPVEDLKIEPMGLANIYQTYHRVTE